MIGTFAVETTERLPLPLTAEWHRRIQTLTVVAPTDNAEFVRLFLDGDVFEFCPSDGEAWSFRDVDPRRLTAVALTAGCFLTLHDRLPLTESTRLARPMGRNSSGVIVSVTRTRVHDLGLWLTRDPAYGYYWK